MLWLIITILFYFILAVVSLVDKYLLIGPISNPKLYTFYVGILSIFALALIPFFGFYVPDFFQIILSLLAGAIYIYGLFWFYTALSLFEASSVVPAISGLVPLFSFGLIYFFSLGKETPSFLDGLAFIFLVFGSFFITWEEKKLINLKSLGIATLTAFLFSLSFVMTKYIYLAQSFWNGFIWIRIGGFLMGVLFFFLVPEIKEEVFQKRFSFQKKTLAIFISNQTAGAGASILQNFAFFLAPLAYIPVIHALQGIQYVFLLIFTIILSLKFPDIIKEKISKKIIFKKIFAIFLIAGGLVMLAF